MMNLARPGKGVALWTMFGATVLAGFFQGKVHAAGVPANLGASLVDGYIHPATRNFSDAAGAMAKALQDYCGLATDPVADPAPAQLVKARFQAVAEAWAGVEFLRFGPLVEDNRFERIFFWPDPRGTVLRRTQAVIAAEDPALLEPGALRANSIAIQGLPSLEYALYGGRQALLAAPGQRYRCAYASAVAANVSGLAAEVAGAWAPQGVMAGYFIKPGPENPLYRDPSEVASEMIKAMSVGLHYIRDAKLLAALGATPALSRPANAPLWRSNLTLDTVAHGLTGIGAFYRAADLSAVFEPDSTWLAGVVTTSAQHIAERLEALDMPLDQALMQPSARSALVSSVVELNDLKEMIDGQVASALGVNVGFNALDGD